MNKKMMQYLVIIAIMVCWCQASFLGAAAPPNTPFNPKPTEGDLILPMPNDAAMVFRKIVVPGRNFWGTPKRVIQIGDGEGDIFEGLQRAQVSGSFYDESGGNWFYYIGKYEVTKGQFAALMGFDELVSASGDTAENAGIRGLKGKKRDKALARPLVFVSWHSLQDFIYRYNQWLFDENHLDRLKNLPTIRGAPGFIRLPLEIEWEYAARGGVVTLKDGRFKKKLPFPAEKLAKHAWFLQNAKHRTRPVGLRQPNPLGLYDMFGNAQELTQDLFQPEIWQGKPGGLPARGGSVATDGKEMRSSRREEVEIYKWNEETKRMQEWRSYNTGIRLAIGSNVVLNPANRAFLEQEYDTYRRTIRANMPVGKTLDNPVAQAASQLNDVRAALADMMDQNQNLKGELSSLQKFIEQAEEKLDTAQREAARSTAQDALRQGADLGRDMFKLESLRRQKTNAENLAKMSTRYQDIVATIQNEIEGRERYARQLIERYTEDVRKLGEYGNMYIFQAFEEIGKKSLTKRAEVALKTLARHVEEYQKKRRIEAQQCWNDFHDTFKELAD
jgi:formylglycine-generating enzyme required for sulfatase activity/regulator of replication initiation timing